MADFSNPYGSNYARAQANKKKFDDLERAQRKKREEEEKLQREMEEISKNIKRREERLKAKEFGIMDQPFAVTVIPEVQSGKATRREKKERRKTGEWADRIKPRGRDRKGSVGSQDDLPEEGAAMLRANLEAQRKEILNLTEQLDAKTREVIALRMTLNEVKEERKKANALERERKASLSAPASPVLPQASPKPTQSQPQTLPQEMINKYEKDIQNLTWQLSLRDTAIEKLKESLADSQLAVQQAQALADKREEQCRLLAVKTKELLDNAKLKEVEFEMQREELKKTKSLLVSMLREKSN